MIGQRIVDAYARALHAIAIAAAAANIKAQARRFDREQAKGTKGVLSMGELDALVDQRHKPVTATEITEQRRAHLERVGREVQDAIDRKREERVVDLGGGQFVVRGRPPSRDGYGFTFEAPLADPTYCRHRVLDDGVCRECGRRLVPSFAERERRDGHANLEADLAARARDFRQLHDGMPRESWEAIGWVKGGPAPYNNPAGFYSEANHPGGVYPSGYSWSLADVCEQMRDAPWVFDGAPANGARVSAADSKARTTMQAILKQEAESFNRPLSEYGSVVFGGQISFNGTAACAKWRLQNIVAIDRETAPTYRWVRVFNRWLWLWPAKPRYRLERRR